MSLEELHVQEAQWTSVCFKTFPVTFTCLSLGQQTIGVSVHSKKRIAFVRVLAATSIIIICFRVSEYCLWKCVCSLVCCSFFFTIRPVCCLCYPEWVSSLEAIPVAKCSTCAQVLTVHLCGSTQWTQGGAAGTKSLNDNQ